ncbi:MAG: uracil-DNA glycosylase [Kiloniellales bacterium]|nr:uracil-DNA glycosylase [Kiloniellales bacterium]
MGAPAPAAPPADCSLCPRLLAFRQDNGERYPTFHNAPVPSFGPADATLLIVGLAPGLKGANQTGRPFTGDYAGDLLYTTLEKFGLSGGGYDRRPDDGLELLDCRVTNAVRCVPPENKPTTEEIRTCQPFLKAEMEALPRLRAILALGTVAHGSVLQALDLKKSAYRFAHGAIHELEGGNLDRGLLFADSYHCSRYNTNTGRLTPTMFEAVFEALLARLPELRRKA